LLNGYFTNVQIAKTVYSLCVVMGDGDIKQTVYTLSTNEDVFMYHRRDLSEDNFPDCRNLNRWAKKVSKCINLSRIWAVQAI